MNLMLSRNLLCLVLIRTILPLSPNPVEANVLGKEICVSGYVMDLYCIQRGTLFDNPQVRTLEDPGIHTYHCLLDVPPCINFGYEILLDPVGNQTLYSRAVRLDSTGNQLALNIGRAQGKAGFCTTCTEELGSNSHGFRATAIGTISDLGSSTSPPTLGVMEFGAEDDLDCPENITNISEMMGDFPFVQAETGTTSFSKAAQAHGSLMMISWGLLLPSGAIIARFYKHKGPLWFKIHRICQSVGLTLAIVGFAIALKNFDALSQTGHIGMYHGIMGIIVMSIGVLQPVNAFFRPHNPEEGEVKKTSRKLWELCHKSLGYSAFVIAFFTIVIGTFLVPENNMTFQIAYGAGCGSLLLGLTAYLINDKKSNIEN